MTTRSGRMKSSMLDPSRRNSGLLAMSNATSAFRFFLITSARARLVPTGTVLLVTTTA